MHAAFLDLDIPRGSRVAGTYISELPLPPGAVISLVVRGGHTLVPDSTTRVKVGDRLLIVSTLQAREATEQALQSVSRAGRLAGWLDSRASQ